MLFLILTCKVNICYPHFINKKRITEKLSNVFKNHITNSKIQTCLMSHPLLFPLLQCCVMDVWNHLCIHKLCTVINCHVPLTVTFTRWIKTNSLRTNLKDLKGTIPFLGLLSLSKSLYILLFNVVFLLPSLNHHYNPWKKTQYATWEKYTYISTFKTCGKPILADKSVVIFFNLFKLWGRLFWAVF